MKKFILILLSILIVASVTSCNKQKQTDTTESIQFPGLTRHHTTEATTENNFIYKKVVFKVLGTDVNLDVDQELNDVLEKSKTIEEPVLNESYKEIGVAYVQYTDTETLSEFGKIFSDNSGKMYILATENKNNALCNIEIDETNN